MVKYSFYIENIPNMDYNLLLMRYILNMHTKIYNFSKKEVKLIMTGQIYFVIVEKPFTKRKVKKRRKYFSN